MAGILVVAEHLQGELRDITGELIGAAKAIAAGIGGPVTVAVIGDAPESFVDAVNLDGVDEILTVTTGPSHFDAQIWEEAVCRIAVERQPRLILVGHTVSGMAFAPAVAARLGGGFASDVFILDAEDGGIVATRSAYGAKVNLEVGFPGRGLVTLTLRGATFEAPETAGAATVSAVDMDLAGLAGVSDHIEYLEAPPSDIDITKADFIMSVGRGIQDQENLPRFVDLAERVGATLGCSRPVADSGWLPKAHQVGQSGKVASSCNLYIALGISGAVQHLFGMKHVDTVIAVNTDPDAPIFGVAKYGACVDVFELADALERQFN